MILPVDFRSIHWPYRPRIKTRRPTMKGDDSSWVFVHSVTASTAVYTMDLSMGLTGDVGFQSLNSESN